MFMNSFRRAHKGFTLAELLIALAILGVIATFTIPKILTAQQNGQNTAIAKEAASMINSAFTTYSLQNTLTTGTTGGALTQYMNYVSVDTTNAYNFGTACSNASLACLKLHNGAVLEYSTAQRFDSTASTGSIEFAVDPDGAGTQTPIMFVQFYNGRLTTGGQAGTAGTNFASVGTGVSNVTTDPSYLQNWN